MVLIVAAVKGSRVLALVSSVAFVLYGVPHVVYHFAHHESLDGLDTALVGGGLIVAALDDWLQGVLWWIARLVRLGTA